MSLVRVNDIINPSEGYIIKQQKQAFKVLIPFITELKQKCLSLNTVYWDDTVIDINTRRGALDFMEMRKQPYMWHINEKTRKG